MSKEVSENRATLSFPAKQVYASPSQILYVSNPTKVLGNVI